MVVGFTGAHGTGKSTLVDRLLKLLPNHRQYLNVQRLLASNLENFPVSSKTNDITQASITSHFVSELLLMSNLVADRTLLDAFAYAEASENVLHYAEIESIFCEALKYYDVIFYTPIEFEVIHDGFRETDEEFRHLIDSLIRKYIKKYDKYIKVITLTGTIEERMETVTNYIKGNL